MVQIYSHSKPRILPVLTTVHLNAYKLFLIIANCILLIILLNLTDLYKPNPNQTSFATPKQPPNGGCFITLKALLPLPSLLHPIKVEARSKVDVVVSTIIVRTRRSVMRAFDLTVIQRDAEVAVVNVTAVSLDVGFQRWET